MTMMIIMISMMAMMVIMMMTNLIMVMIMMIMMMMVMMMIIMTLKMMMMMTLKMMMYVRNPQASAQTIDACNPEPRNCRVCVCLAPIIWLVVAVIIGLIIMISRGCPIQMVTSCQTLETSLKWSTRATARQRTLAGCTASLLGLESQRGAGSPGGAGSPRGPCGGCDRQGTSNAVHGMERFTPYPNGKIGTGTSWGFCTGSRRQATEGRI